MSYFARVENNIVQDVISADQSFVDTQLGVWIQTSYNTRGGIHYGSNGQPDGGVALRANFAGIGYTYDSVNDVFYGPQPFPSWVLNQSTWTWEAPIAYPTDGKDYTWDEATKTWKAIEAK
jgi:hypothetical protein